MSPDAGFGDTVAADFVSRFTGYWRAPSVAGLDDLLAPEVVLRSPMTPTTHGLKAGRRTFAGLFHLIPDMTAEVHRWGATEDGVMIEFTTAGHVAGAAVGWNAVDRFVLGSDGLARERISYFDSTPLALKVARTPRAWPAFARSRLRR